MFQSSLSGTYTYVTSELYIFFVLSTKHFAFLNSSSTYVSIFEIKMNYVGILLYQAIGKSDFVK